MKVWRQRTAHVAKRLEAALEVRLRTLSVIARDGLTEEDACTGEEVAHGCVMLAVVPTD